MRDEQTRNDCGIDHAPGARETARRLDTHFARVFGVDADELFGAGDGGEF